MIFADENLELRSASKLLVKVADQSMQNEWAKNNFLKKTTGGNGRKLELDRFN